MREQPTKFYPKKSTNYNIKYKNIAKLVCPQILLDPHIITISHRAEECITLKKQLTWDQVMSQGVCEQQKYLILFVYTF